MINRVQACSWEVMKIRNSHHATCQVYGSLRHPGRRRKRDHSETRGRARTVSAYMIYAYLHVQINLNSRRYLGFQVGGGFINSQYLDNWLQQLQAQEQGHQSILWIPKLIAQLGFGVHATKSELEPTKQFIFPGVQFDLETFTVAAIPDRLKKLWSILRRMRRPLPWTARLIQQFKGSIVHVSSHKLGGDDT